MRFQSNSLLTMSTHRCQAIFWLGAMISLTTITMTACSGESQPQDTAIVFAEATAISLRPEPIEQVSDGAQTTGVQSRDGQSIAATSAASGQPAAVTVAASTPKGEKANMEGQSGAPLLKPELLDISPARGPAGSAYPIAATLRGRGFAATGNTVTFGPVTMPDLPSADGASISFMVPKAMQSRSEVPPLILPANEYWVTVSTSAGTSNWVTFTLTRDP